MKAITELRIGLVAALIAIAYWIPALSVALILVYTSQEERLFFGVFLLTHMIPLITLSFYIFALLKKRLALARWTYNILVACIIYFAALRVFQGLFVKESSEGLAGYVIFLIVITVLFVVLVVAPFRIGIRGLKRISEARSELWQGR